MASPYAFLLSYPTSPPTSSLTSRHSGLGSWITCLSAICFEHATGYHTPRSHSLCSCPGPQPQYRAKNLQSFASTSPVLTSSHALSYPPRNTPALTSTDPVTLEEPCRNDTVPSPTSPPKYNAFCAKGPLSSPETYPIEYCVGRFKITPMLPFSLCSSIKITAWWKYCCPCVKLSPRATSRHPRSGAPITCAQGFSAASAGFCSRSSSRFGPEASSTFSSSSVEEPAPDSMDTRRARKSRQSPSSAGATSSSAEDNKLAELSVESPSTLAFASGSFSSSFLVSDASLFFVSGAVAEASEGDASADAASLASELLPSEPSAPSAASDTSALSSSSERLARVATEETVGASRMTWPTRRSRARAADARRWRTTAGAGGATARAAARESIAARVSEVRYEARPAVSCGCG